MSFSLCVISFTYLCLCSSNVPLLRSERGDHRGPSKNLQCTLAMLGLTRFVIMVLCTLQISLCRLRDGLSTLGVLESMKRNSSVWTAQFCELPTALSATAMMGLFTEDSTSEPSSNRRQQEEQTLSWWNDYLLDVEAEMLEFGNALIIIY